MYSEKAQNKIDGMVKEHKKQLNGLYLQIEAHEKIMLIAKKFGMDVYFFDSLGSSYSSLSMRYNLGKKESLMYKANLILEEVDETLNFTRITPSDQPEFSYFHFECMYKGKIKVQITIDFSESENCNLEYEDVTTKKAVLKCA